MAFEDEFTDLQADMVGACLEYCEGNAQKIYIYATQEYAQGGGKRYFDFFFKAGGQIVNKLAINEVLPPKQQIDTGREAQLAVLSNGNSDLEQIRELCQKYDRDCPTNMWLTYNVETGGFEAKYTYDLLHYTNEDVISDYISAEWMDCLREENGQEPDDQAYLDEVDRNNRRWKQYWS